MSILSISDQFKKPTHKWLIANGFDKIPWGTPDGRFKNGKLKWPKYKYCYELYVEVEDCVYNGFLVYFPDGFNSYVLPDGINFLKEPANKAYISLNSTYDRWYQIIDVNDTSDIELAKLELIKELKKRDKRLWSK